MKNYNLENLTKLGSGSLSDVYKIDCDKVLVVGKRADCYSNYTKLYENSKLINGKIKTINYPKIHLVIAPCNQFEFGAMVEDYVSGKELQKCILQLSIENKKELVN